MSGTVPPPPPPPPGAAPEPEGTPVSGVPPRVSRVPSAYRMPPSVSPSRSGEVPVQSVPAPGPAPTVAHTPASYPTAARYPAAPTPAWSAQPAAYPTQAYAPQAYAPQQPAQGDWWGDQWNGAPAQQPQQIPPGGYQPAHHAYAAYATAARPAAAPAVAPAGPGDGTGTTSRRRKGGLTPGWIAFIAVDALLLIVAVVFAVQIFAGGGGAPTDEAEAGAGAGAQATQEAGEDGEGTEDGEAADDELPEGEVLAEFASPSRNITCQITTAGASCGIAELDQQPAPVEGCDGTTGYVVAIDGEGRVSLPCVPSSDQPQKAGDGTNVLEYGQSVTEGDYTCSSAETGMSCTYDPSGRGFSLARAGIGTF